MKLFEHVTEIKFKTSPMKEIVWYKHQDMWMLKLENSLVTEPMTLAAAEKITEQAIHASTLSWDDNEVKVWLSEIEKPTHFDYPYYKAVHDAVLSHDPKAYDIYKHGDTYCREGVDDRIVLRILELSGLELEE